MKKCIQLHISGKVQGVYFRAATKEKADELGVGGVVLNQHDGRVYIEAEGEEEALKAFADWCWKGPPRAKVDQVRIENSPLKNFNGFEILR